jgi:uncharacterized membrane protein YukC
MENFLASWGPIIFLAVMWLVYMKRYGTQKSKTDTTIEKISSLLDETNKLLKDIHIEMKKRNQ